MERRSAPDASPPAANASAEGNQGIARTQHRLQARTKPRPQGMLNC